MQELCLMKKKNKVLLFHCARYNNLTNIIAMGLWGIADYLTMHGYQVSMIHTKVEELYYGNFEVDRYMDDQVIMVGFSAHWFPMVNECLDIAQRIKGLRPNTLIEFGGLSASYFATTLLEEYSAVDVVVKGDGEEPLRELLENLRLETTDFENVSNLVWKKDNIIVDNGITYKNTSENVYEIHYAKQNKYLLHYDFAQNTKVFCNSYTDFCSFQPRDFKCNKTFFLLTGKGCPVNCTFCGGGHDAQVMMNDRRKCLYLKDDQIIQTIKEAMELGYYDFSVCFDTVPQKPHYLGWLRKIAEENLDINLMFGFWGLPPLEVFDDFKQAAKNLLFEISPETYSEKIRNFNRGFSFSNDDMERVVQKCCDEKIYLHMYFAYPMPNETYQDVLNTRKYTWQTNVKYPHYIETFYIRLSTDPASPIYQRPGDYDCELLVSSLKEHLQAARDTTDGNVLVHRKKSFELPEQNDIYKYIYQDSIVTSIFRYAIKIIARAFDSIDAFTACLDDFYRKIETMQLSYFAYIDAFQNHIVLEKYGAKKWLNDFMKLIRSILWVSENSADVKLQEKMQISALTKMNLAISEHVYVLKTTYNVYEAYQHLLIAKQYAKIEKSDEEKYYMLYKKNGRMEINEMNVTLFELISNIKEKKTVAVGEICSLTAAEYTNDRDVLQQIYKDFMETCQLMYRDGIFINK